MRERMASAARPEGCCCCCVEELLLEVEVVTASVEKAVGLVVPGRGFAATAEEPPLPAETLDAAADDAPAADRLAAALAPAALVAPDVCAPAAELAFAFALAR